VARASKARDTQTEEGGTNETRAREEPRPGDSSGFADSARAASHGTASSSSERDSARGAFGEYLSSVQATLDAWEGTDLRNPELAGVGRRTRATRRARANGSTSGVASFLVEISQTKLLSKEEEVLLATNVQQQARVVAARVAVAERAGKDPNDVSETELARALGAASAADLETLRITANRSKQLLLRHNLRLVVSVAKKFIGRGVALEDLIQEGIGGLIRGVEGFDPERGFKFSTYAHWWIRQSCSRAVNDQSRTIRLPVHVYDALSKLQKCRVALQSLDESAHAYAGADAAGAGGGGTKQDLTVSDEHVTYDEDPFDTVQDAELQEDIESALATLAPRERNVLRMAYGMGAGEDDEARREPMNLGDIGTHYGLSRERIRQIQSGALSKLRQPVRALPLAEFLDEDEAAER